MMIESLLLRGARQVGKTFATRKLGKKFKNFIEINCEEEEDDCKIIFEKDLKPKRILKELSVIAGATIVPGETLLFLDKIQTVPRWKKKIRTHVSKYNKLNFDEETRVFANLYVDRKYFIQTGKLLKPL